jgi:hypothetical protein
MGDRRIAVIGKQKALPNADCADQKEELTRMIAEQFHIKEHEFKKSVFISGEI